MGALLTPFLVMWTFIKIFLPDEIYDLSVTVAMLIWLVWVVMLWAWAKSDAGNYICFPQSKWRFPDETSRTFDLKVPPDSWERLADPFPDGSVPYRVDFSEKYLHDDLDMPFPRVFGGAYWLLPSWWDTSFQRRAYGEFFHKGVYITKPDCEDISVYVLGYNPMNGYPICIINDCALTFENTVRASKHLSIGQLARLNSMQMLYQEARKKAGKMLTHTAYLEERVELAEKDTSQNFKDSADNRLRSVRGRHASIMSTAESWRTRIFNLRNIVIMLAILTGIYLYGKLIMGWW